MARAQSPASRSSRKSLGPQGVSRTPVREGLAAARCRRVFVDTVSNSGTFVARIPLRALPEAMVVRKALEQVTVRAAALNARKSEVTGLRAILERQREADAAGDRTAFHGADEAFHAAVATAGGYPGIWSLVQGVGAWSMLYRH